MTSSIAFDQAVPFYDKTRSDPEWVGRAVTGSILQLAGAVRDLKVLEIGIGTGRIAIPLLERGIPLVGVDLSSAMMAELVKKIAPRDYHVGLAQADAGTLPFPAETWDLVYAVHVYHLVAGWQSALREAYRVVRPGGALLVSFHHRDPQSPNRLLRQKLHELALERGVDNRRPGVHSSEELLAELARWSKPEVVEVARWTAPVRPAKLLDEIASRVYSETWSIPESVLAAIIPDLRTWAQTLFGDVTRDLPEEGRFSWMVVRKPQ
jgi:ubiquinone/menaquinone biosynthesis C-methylase UbiE